MFVVKTIQELAKNKEVFSTLLIHTDEAFRMWRLSKEKWSLHEIVCHLLDEERNDFRARIQYILDEPDHPMPSINPPDWVVSKNYQAWNYDDTVAALIIERAASVNTLMKLSPSDWKKKYNHSKLGTISTEYLVYNWLAHDYLHIRQINLYRYTYLKEQCGLDISYAGNW
jgi:hypothetical protein